MLQTQNERTAVSRRTAMLAGLALALYAATAAAHPAVAAQTIRIGTEGLYAPFSFKTSDGRLTGYDVEVAREAARRLGIEVIFVEAPWDALIAGLAAKRFDAVFNQVSPTAERAKRFAFSTPYAAASGAAVVRKGAAAPAGLNDLKGLRAAQTIGTNWTAAVERAGAKVMTVKTGSDAFAMVAAGRADVAVNALEAWDDFAKTRPNAPLAVAFAFEDPQGGAAGLFRKSDEALARQFSAEIERMGREGVLKTLSIRFTGRDLTPAALSQ